jgi:16S rRNA (guanine966-N2)-methyltransferase
VTRIISGRAGGRRIQAPPGSATRPTSDRVREALFSRLEHLDVLQGARVLDLYAGSGALGLEAASRGAAAVVLVEQARPAAAVIRRNAASLADVLQGVRVRAEPVERALAAAPQPQDRFDLVLLDPPYDLAGPELARILGALAAPGWLTAGAAVVVERSAAAGPPTLPDGWRVAWERLYGDTLVVLTGPDAGDRTA